MKTQKITIEQYIAERLDDQIHYYAGAASRAKQKFQRTKVAELALAASVPLFSALITQSNADVFKIIVGTIGVAISILSGLLLLYKFDENWVTYRTTAEALKSEKYLFLTRSGAYRGKQAGPLFIERIESILGEEHTKWQSYILQTTDAEAETDTETDGAGTPTPVTDVSNLGDAPATDVSNSSPTVAPATDVSNISNSDAPAMEPATPPADGSDAVPPPA